MTARISRGLGRHPSEQHLRVGAIDLDPQRVASRRIAGMLRTAIAAGACRERAQQIDLGEELKVIAGAHRACLHEILMLFVGETGAHKDVEHIMHMRFGLMQGQPGFEGQCAGQV